MSLALPVIEDLPLHCKTHTERRFDGRQNAWGYVCQFCITADFIAGKLSGCLSSQFV